ncbi:MULTISPECIES: pPIWI_RE_Y domain-containing protein [unclassified Streptomyces]|uniref:pPIWI_RE_Y domain-containing protein n=1 Tax=unclassified Streptomyces TaxID=2593676 RepID=UPI00114D0C2D|nr:hypothetical protein [Streptomyces sp. ScaeMP-e83]MYR92366.1 hypothetical protein [Streptomyces sp. SID4937]
MDDHPGTVLFAELARSVVALAAREQLRSFALPYPSSAQRVLDRMVLYCLDRGWTPPRSVPEVMAWCAEHTAGGPLFQVPTGFLSPEARLIDPVGRLPSRVCLELASHGPQGEVEQEAVDLLIDLEARCGSVERYSRCRRFLADRPVIGQRDPFSDGSHWNPALWKRVKNLYEPVPEYLLSRRILALCGTCGLPALSFGQRAVGPSTWCEGEVCPPGVRFRLIRDPGRTLLLRRSLRIFLCLSGPTESAALTELSRAGVGHEPVPAGLGAHFLHTGAAAPYLLRTYDRLEPALLASRVAGTPVDATAGTLVVVPRRQADRPGYRTAFAAALGEGCRERIMLTTPGELVCQLGILYSSRKGNPHA